MKKKYLNNLDVSYFKECAQKGVDELLSDSDYDLETKLNRLNVMRSQIYGLRDLFWLFVADDIYKIVEPVKEALNKLEKERRESDESEI